MHRPDDTELRLNGATRGRGEKTKETTEGVDYTALRLQSERRLKFFSARSTLGLQSRQMFALVSQTPNVLGETTAGFMDSFMFQEARRERACIFTAL